MRNNITSVTTRAEVAQPGEEKAPGTPYSTFQLKGAKIKMKRDFLPGHVVIGQGAMASN